MTSPLHNQPPSETACPYCHSATIQTSHHTGDTLCTSCGIVLSSHYLEQTPEWIHYDNDDVQKCRVGAPVDESQWRGGIMPTTLGRVPYIKTGNSEETRRLGGIRRRLMKTHALVESMMENEWKTRYDDVVLESKVRDAKRGRGEDVEELNGITCGGDYEELMGNDDRVCMMPLRDRKWVVKDAVLLYGSLDEISLYLPREDGWTSTMLANERRQLFQSLNAASRSTAWKLYVAFGLLYRAVTKLELDRILSEMLAWLVEYAKKRELKVKGISRETCGEQFSLSLLDYDDIAKKKSPIDLHRIKQYASLCSAIIYLAAKRNGKGRTLAEICGALGTVRCETGEEALVRPKYCSKAMQELRTALPNLVVAPIAATSASLDDSKSFTDVPKPLTPVKTQSRSCFNEGPTSVISLSSHSSVGAVIDSSNHNVITDDSSVNTNIASSSENDALADLTSRLATCLNLPPSAIAAAVAIAVQCLNDTNATTPITNQPRQQIRPPIRRGSKHNSSLFIINQRVNRTSGLSAALNREGSSDLIASASILLACMAGKKMQVLAQQAVSNYHETQLNATDASSHHHKDEKLDVPIESLSNPFDNLAEEMSFNTHSLVETTSSTGIDISTPTETRRNSTKPSSIVSWTAWNKQPPWHRGVSQIEECSGIASKSIISYYSNVIHPRRSYYLDVARKRLIHSPEYEDVHPRKRLKLDDTVESPSLLQNITAAAPLISIRGL